MKTRKIWDRRPLRAGIYLKEKAYADTMKTQSLCNPVVPLNCAACRRVGGTVFESQQLPHLFSVPIIFSDFTVNTLWKIRGPISLYVSLPVFLVSHTSQHLYSVISSLYHPPLSWEVRSLVTNGDYFFLACSPRAWKRGSESSSDKL